MNWVNRISMSIGKVLSAIGVDGMAHILVCQNLIMWLSKLFPLWLAVAMTAAIFVLKEVYDKYCKESEISAKDLLCDCAGSLLGVLTLIV